MTTALVDYQYNVLDLWAGVLFVVIIEAKGIEYNCRTAVAYLLILLEAVLVSHPRMWLQNRP